jgi:hypothetical protein
MLPEGCRSLTDIQHNIKYPALVDVNQFGVCERWELKVHAPYDIAVRDGEITLPEVCMDPVGIEKIRVEDFYKTTTQIFKFIKVDEF